VALDVTYRTVQSSGADLDLDLVDLRRALGARTQAEAAQLLGVTAKPGHAGNGANCSSTRLERTNCVDCINW